MRSIALCAARHGLRSVPRARPICSSRLSQSFRSFRATATRLDEDDRKWSTPLAKQLADAINITGPVPLASYMRMCLTADVGGYYTGALEEGRDPFGRKGDFITSPEISQVFGELIGIWFVAEWMSQGRPKQGVELIEVGPGRGTLMDDILRTIRNFKDMAASIDAVYMVEASGALRQAQKNLLCGEEAAMSESKAGYHSTSKYSGLPIVWTETIRSIPQGPAKTPFMIAHEFFDALPIHAFQVVEVPPAPPSSPSPAPVSSPNAPSPRPEATSPTLQWREMVVAPTPPDATHESLGTPKSEQHGGPPPDFQLTLSPSTTRHAQYLPEASARYRALKRTPNAVIEVCPDASLYASDFASRIGGSPQHPKARPSGAALILDYGPSETIPVNSLRGIRQHKRVSPFSEPGLVDLSADVDFMAIAETAMRASEGVEVHGPVAQADFLDAMGIQQRAEMLAARAGDDDGTKKKEIEKAWRRLVDRGPGGMGKLYKALAILPENSGRRRPVGFGGDVLG